MSKITTLFAGEKFGNYKLRSNTEIGFNVIDDESVVVMLLKTGIAESGENEREAVINLKWFISDLLEEYRANPEQRLGRRLAQQMRLLDEILE